MITLSIKVSDVWTLIPLYAELMTLTTGRKFSSRICTIIFLYIYSFFSWLSWTIILKSYLPYLQRHTTSISASSLHHCLGKWTQELRPLSNTLSSPPSRTSSLQEPSFQDQLTLFFVVSSSLPIRNCHICQKYSSKVKTTINFLVHLQMWVSYTYLTGFLCPPWRCGPGRCTLLLGKHLINLHRPVAWRMDLEKGSSSSTRNLPSPQPSSFQRPLPGVDQIETQNSNVSFYIKKVFLEVIHSVIHSFIFISPVGRRIHFNLKSCRRLPIISWI